VECWSELQRLSDERVLLMRRLAGVIMDNKTNEQVRISARLRELSERRAELLSEITAALLD
jgi:hypothetical protein